MDKNMFRKNWYCKNIKNEFGIVKKNNLEEKIQFSPKITKNCRKIFVIHKVS